MERYENEREERLYTDEAGTEWPFEAESGDWGEAVTEADVAPAFAAPLTVAVGETITLDGPVQVEFREADGSVRGVASVGDGGQLNLTGVAGITFVAVPYEAERWAR